MFYNTYPGSRSEMLMAAWGSDSTSTARLPPQGLADFSQDGGSAQQKSHPCLVRGPEHDLTLYMPDIIQKGIDRHLGAQRICSSRRDEPVWASLSGGDMRWTAVGCLVASAREDTGSGMEFKGVDHYCAFAYI
jgi:hypothetical protein